MKPAVMILGATSGIAGAVAEAFAARGHGLVLLGRRADALAAMAADLQLRHGVTATHHPLDVEAADGGAADVQAALAASPALAGAVVCFGYLGDQATGQADWREARRILDTNFTGAVCVLETLAAHFEALGAGFLVGFSSVAGDRGRQSNYLYGSAKAGLTAYLQGLRNRLAHRGVHVLTVKPGFVDTPMTYGKPGMFLVARPEAIARGLLRALDAGRSSVYLPWFWAGIMAVIRAIPEPVFKRMRL